MLFPELVLAEQKRRWGARVGGGPRWIRIAVVRTDVCIS